MDIVDIMFRNKSAYNDIPDEDKIDNFFIINRKFSRKYPKVGKMFNDKFTDKASALDRWYLHFMDTDKIPYWYFNKREKKKDDNVKHKLTSEEKSILIKEYKLKESDITYLMKHYKESVYDTLKKHKK